jgi:ribonucleotide reductase alpha subunit
MTKAKTGNWFVDNPQRGRSNNSAVIVRDAADRKQFARLMQSVREFGEPGFVFVDSKNHTTNPCLSGDTMVKVKDHDVISNGEVIAKGVEYEIPMEELKKMFDHFKECGGSLEQYMPLALSYNTDTGKKEYKQILWADKTRENAEMIKITLDDGKTVRCTPDHKIYTTNRGYVEAKDLTEDDDLVVV